MMSLQAHQREAIQLITDQLNALWQIVDKARRNEDHEAARERLARWRVRVGELMRRHVNPDEARKFLGRQRLTVLTDPFRDLLDEAEMHNGFLRALREEMENHPEMVWHEKSGARASEPNNAGTTVAMTQAVFVVHGHDELNLHRLQALLADRWNLRPIILASKPGRGRTLIEKFEDEAESAGFAFVLLTPDDAVVSERQSYSQARPNVLFELGWFYGRLGRQRVCILFQRGTRLHSDLDGITRIEFAANVEEVALAVERELQAAGIIAD